jgi:hypothetical protein
MPFVYRHWQDLESAYTPLWEGLGEVNPSFLANLRDDAVLLQKVVSELGLTAVITVVAGEGKPKIFSGELKPGCPVKLLPSEVLRIIFRPNGEISIDIAPAFMEAGAASARRT